MLTLFTCPVCNKDDMDADVYRSHICDGFPILCWSCRTPFEGLDDMVVEEGDIYICKKCSIEWDKD